MLEPIFKKVASLEARKSIKRRLQYRFFPVNIAKFLKTAFSIKHLVAASRIETFTRVREPLGVNDFN